MEMMNQCAAAAGVWASTVLGNNDEWYALCNGWPVIK
eukprot:CAMPEP_0181189504 /NCGR_PEP_ID=MMETSP1096-20121128/11695_1 /TAXON_ID=156174 ORGANISM="Chrysochromulina ericina, Strain CCMP281" /NCGR_SAMPLE_ID=MMETSP1096 /ASSEMBLY_ACC=CAM_ASM_000453 /LENGTH=36 /DNA_ID= /DNA_START= /DNA_END= /DNA_ORIENTATION=